jgi:signal transduction histidine kinase
VTPPPTTDTLHAPHHRGGRDTSRSRHLVRRPTEPSEAALDAFDERDRFAAYIAHELRTPIALQLALAEAALADPDADARALRPFAESVVASCEEQQLLIEALLDLTRSRRGLARQAPVDIAAIARQALEAHVFSDVDSVVALEPAVATGDPTLLQRLAANLVSNAIRHNIPHGRIEVVTRSEAGRARLSVTNTGPFIPAGELTRLFQPFERLGAQPHDRADGAGLGLAIVQSIADAHNATVSARTRAGGGLKIEVRFPRASAKTSVEAKRCDVAACLE